MAWICSTQLHHITGCATKNLYRPRQIRGSRIFRFDKLEVMGMLMRTDPFRELDRLTQQVFGTAARPTAMPMDAWRENDRFIVEFDLPGIDVSSIDLDVERNVLTVRAERPAREGIEELVAAERPRGLFSRQLILGDNLDTEHVQADYRAGVLRLQIPVAERAKPRKISVSTSEDERVLQS
jgi:HSP20 family protein